MKNRWRALGLFFILTASVVNGCAHARPRHQETAMQWAPAPAAQVSTLQSEMQAKDQQIQDLQYQLEQSRHASESNFNNSSASTALAGGKSSRIHVSGVSVTDVQQALAKAGFDPGPADGKMGKKTKAAIKAFQRSHSLKADGVVGDKTWKLLQS